MWTRIQSHERRAFASEKLDFLIQLWPRTGISPWFFLGDSWDEGNFLATFSLSGVVQEKVKMSSYVCGAELEGIQRGAAFSSWNCPLVIVLFGVESQPNLRRDNAKINRRIRWQPEVCVLPRTLILNLLIVTPDIYKAETSHFALRVRRNTAICAQLLWLDLWMSLSSTSGPWNYNLADQIERAGDIILGLIAIYLICIASYPGAAKIDRDEGLSCR